MKCRIKKDGIIKTVDKKELDRFQELGFKLVEESKEIEKVEVPKTDKKKK